jgi:hypothetical protein
VYRIPMKLARLITMCLNEIYSKHLSNKFSIQNNLKEGDALTPIFALEYDIRKVQGNLGRMKLNETHHLLSMLIM